MRKLLLAFCFASAAFAQQGANDARLLNLPSAALVGPMTLEVLFTHRFSQPVDAAGGENLFGLDGPADVGIGLALGLGRLWQMELYRSSYLKTVELAGKVGLPRQTLGATVAVRGGGVYRLRPVGGSRWAGFLQAAASWKTGRALEVLVVPTWVSDTPTLRRAANVGFGVVWHGPKRWRVLLELVPENPRARRAAAAWALGVSKGVPGHSFVIYLGNSRATTSDLWPGSDFPGGLRLRDARLGFNLVRRFPE
jgi:hypothetical protein